MSWTNLKTKTVTIKKQRQCWGCERIFPVGSQMVYNVGAWVNEGIVATYQCPTCSELQKYIEPNFCDGYCLGYVLDEVIDCDESHDIKTPEDLLTYFRNNKSPA